MTPTPPRDPLAGLNDALSEVLDVVQEVKQAHRIVPETHALHAVLDQLFDDLRGWGGMLIEQDEVRGVSPLATMPSAAGRTVPNLWPSGATDEEVRQTVDEYLERLQDHVRAGREDEKDEGFAAILAEIEQGLIADRQLLAAIPPSDGGSR
jgi:hypothetical protein